MRRIMSLVAVVILALLVILIVRNNPDSSTSPSGIEATDSSTVPTTAGGETTDSTVRTLPSTTISDGTTDSTETRPSASPDAPVLPAEFAIREVVFGDGGYVVIENVGGEPGSLNGYALCQRPSYLNLPDITLAPLETVWVAVGDGANLTSTAAVEVVPANGSLGVFRTTDGEMALYSAPNFAAADAIVTYVEWGSSGHGRSTVAIEAGIWVEGAFVEIPDDAFGVQAVESPARSPQDWVAGLGG